jgi:hypothetical protein
MQSLPDLFDSFKQRELNEDRLISIENSLQLLLEQASPVKQSQKPITGETITAETNALKRIELILQKIYVYSKIFVCFDKQILARIQDILETRN